ncbi:hypothetical protein [Pseudovibrio sp. Ad26]|uniref:hypothetical protein n=1 Tax=Pseudovibrio sp. Ad26 TaxID=989410 RepID=UPI0007B2368B|nr:hypothetical protein [Pseudovibrio sp. Ad26]KZK85736.1 hypothetical protein PsAD46_03327 [Pseudovibrio sp. Ad46]KZL10677.1 hypothetical protein PsAD26_03041 [Pseudovibrio sp. Ad26]
MKVKQKYTQKLSDVRATLAAERGGEVVDRVALSQSARDILACSGALFAQANSGDILAAVQRIYSNFSSNTPEVAEENIRSICELLALEQFSVGAIQQAMYSCLKECRFAPVPSEVYSRAEAAEELLMAEQRLLEAIEHK